MMSLGHAEHLAAWPRSNRSRSRDRARPRSRRSRSAPPRPGRRCSFRPARPCARRRAFSSITRCGQRDDVVGQQAASCHGAGARADRACRSGARSRRPAPSSVAGCFRVGAARAGCDHAARSCRSARARMLRRDLLRRSAHRPAAARRRRAAARTCRGLALVPCRSAADLEERRPWRRGQAAACSAA